MEDGYSEQYRTESSSYSGYTKLPGRSTQQTQDQSIGMVIERVSSSEHFSDLGDSTDGSVCIREELQNQDLLLMVSKQSSVCDRCSEHFVGEHVCVCLPTNMHDSQSTELYVAVPLSNNIDCSSMAEETLVHRNTEPISSLSDQTSIKSRSSHSTTNTDKAPRTRVVQTDSMAAVDGQYRKVGFSKNTRELLKAAWRQGTQRDYSSKFRKFNSWCSKRKIDPYSVSLIQITDFLSDLFKEGLQYRTINGYRSMLSAVVPQIDNCKVGQHPYVIQLLKGIFNSRPPTVRLVPEWDLIKVLEALQKKPFEPLHKANLKMVTFKTVFLIAITSFRRSSDLKSLKIGEGSINIQHKGITFLRHGLAKQDRPTHFGSKLFIPALHDNKKLDPKRSLYYYLKATEKFRKSGSGEEETSLFLSLNEPHRPVKSQTIAGWIVSTLRTCLEDKQLKVKAHSTRAIGPSFALFRGASMESILASADWSKETTFTRFYLRDVSVNSKVLDI